MKLACNYCHEAELLVRERKIELDYFKFPALDFQVGLLHDANAFEAFAARVSALRPILLHGIYPEMDRLVPASRTPGLSFHPELGKCTPNELAAFIQSLQAEYEHLDFISIENSGTIELKPLVLSQIVRQSGCTFLLDVSHAYCASRQLGMDFWTYLSQLPLERMHEIHLNGWFEKDNDIMCHVKTNEAGYTILKELLTICEPKIITIEYGCEDDRIGCDCPILRPGEINERAMEEIVEQVTRIRAML
jgi:uncharacterized protein (UPF0276 family)